MNRDMPTLPPDVVPYKRTKSFTECTVPQGLLADHQTKVGTWAVISVEEGVLLYRISEPGHKGVHRLSPEVQGIVHPQHKHHIELQGTVRFYVEFYQ